MSKCYILRSLVHGEHVPVGKVYATLALASEAALELNGLLPGLRLEVAEVDMGALEVLPPRIQEHVLTQERVGG